jgi:hypothetical protein
VAHVEHDGLKSREDTLSPCGKRHFDPSACFGPAIADLDEFVIDLGGGTVFTRDVDNEARLRSVVDFARNNRITIVLVDAPEAVVSPRYVGCKGGTASGFAQDWPTWQEFGRVYWSRCADVELDASHSRDSTRPGSA